MKASTARFIEAGLYGLATLITGVTTGFAIALGKELQSEEAAAAAEAATADASSAE